MRNVTFIVGKQEKAACATHCNFKIVHMCSIIVRYFQNGFLSINYVHNQFQNIQWFIFKVLQKSRFFQKCVCQNMPKNEIYIHNYVRNQFKTFSCFHFQGIAKKKCVCQNMPKMRFISINYVRNQFKTFSCSCIAMIF